MASASVRAGPNDANDFVDIGQREQQAFDRVLPPAGLVQQKLRPPANHRHPVPQELFEKLLQRAGPRLAIDQGQQNDRKRVLQRRKLIKLSEHDVGIGVALELDRRYAPGAADRCSR